MTDKEPIYIVAGKYGFRDELEANKAMQFIRYINQNPGSNLFSPPTLQMHTSFMDFLMDVKKQVEADYKFAQSFTEQEPKPNE